MADGEKSLTRVQPHDNDAERRIIGELLSDREAISDVSAIITKEDFYNERYGLLFDAIISLYNEGKEIDDVVLSSKLKEMGVPEEVSELSYIGDILAETATSVFAKDHAEIIRNKSLSRQLIKYADRTAYKCYEGKEPVKEMIEDAEQEVFKLAQSSNGNSDFTPMKDIVIKVLGDINAATKLKGRVNGLRTGFNELDTMLTGLHGGELILIGARPAMGKTAFVLNIVHHVAMRENVPVAVFNLEMSKESLAQRIISVDAMVDAQATKSGQISPNDWNKLIETADRMAKAPIFINDNSALTIGEMRSECRRLKQQENIGLIVIDYLQLMNSPKSVESRQLFISDVSRQLKVMAKELGVPVIALSQLNRAVDSRPDHHPVLADLRESGSIEQDADVVMFLYRDEAYNKETERPGVAEVIVAKQRSGSTGSVDLAWLGKYTKFANLERKKKED